MESRLEVLSKKILHKQLSGIPEKHRDQFVKLIRETQTDIKHKFYQSKTSQDLVSIKIKSDGTIENLEFNQNLFEKYSNYQDLATAVASAVITAHEEAFEVAKKDLNLQMAQLENKIYLLSRDINAENENK